MTPDPLLCERIAKRWCELMGLDPYDTIQHGADPEPGGYIPAILLYSPRWQRVAREVPAQMAWVLAIREGV